MMKLKFPKDLFPALKLFRVKSPAMKLPDWLVRLIDRWNFAKKYSNIAIPLVALITAVVITTVFSSPLIYQAVKMGLEIKAIDLEIRDYQDRLDRANSLDEKLLKKKLSLLVKKLDPNFPVANVLNRIKDGAKRFNIRIVSINPGDILLAPDMAEMPGHCLMILPIEMSLQSEYKNFGDFMDSLGRLPGCLIVITGYSLHRVDEIFPRLAAQLSAQAYFLGSGVASKPAVMREIQALEQTSQKGDVT